MGQKYNYDDFVTMPMDELNKLISTRVLGQTKLIIANEVRQSRLAKENQELSHALVISSKKLVSATWGLVIITAILSIITFVVSIK